MANYEVAVKSGSSDIHIRVFSTFTDALTPVPAEIGQLDNQLVQFFDSHTVPSKYPTNKQVGRRLGFGSPTTRFESTKKRVTPPPHKSKSNSHPDDAPATEHGERGEFHEEESLRVPGQGPGLGPLHGRAGGQRVGCV